MSVPEAAPSASLQKIGKSLMLPVSVLPVAGILLGVGQRRSFAWHAPSDRRRASWPSSGDAIFGSLPLIFAIGVALGLANNDGVAALAAVGRLPGDGRDAWASWPRVSGVEPEPRSWASRRSTPASSAASSSAAVAAYLFNRFYRHQAAVLPGLLRRQAVRADRHRLRRHRPRRRAGASSGRRSRRSSTSSRTGRPYGNPPRRRRSSTVSSSGSLLPFGLHHIWNVPFFFEIGTLVNAQGQDVHGDITGFFAGRPDGRHPGRRLPVQDVRPVRRRRSPCGAAREAREPGPQVGGLMVSAR